MRVPGKPTPLRERMIGEMRLRGYAPRTMEAYVSAVRALARHFGRAPDLLDEEVVRAYLVGLTDRGVARGTHSIALSGIRFLYQHTLHRDALGGTLASRTGSSDTNRGDDQRRRYPFCATGRMLVVEVFPRPRPPP